MTTTVTMPAAHHATTTVTLASPAALPVRSDAPRSRDVYAAVHVVADPLRACADLSVPQIDWDATLRLRHDLWALGLGVAESMDTAQRGMGLTWGHARELALRTLAEAATVGGRVVVGVSTDQLDASAPTLDQIIDAYREQIDAVESAGGDVVMMASRHLARTATSVDDYRTVYDAVLGDATRPVILHWLGAAFDPQLSGYWGFDEPKAAMPTVASLIADHGNKVRGIKVSLLDAALKSNCAKCSRMHRPGSTPATISTTST